jgi:hypothetical protein
MGDLTRMEDMIMTVIRMPGVEVAMNYPRKPKLGQIGRESSKAQPRKSKELTLISLSGLSLFKGLRRPLGPFFLLRPLSRPRAAVLECSSPRFAAMRLSMSLLRASSSFFPVRRHCHVAHMRPASPPP